MIYTITIILSVLVAVNLVLLGLNTNKFKKTRKATKAKISRPTAVSSPTRTLTNPQVSSPLSPTGS